MKFIFLAGVFAASTAFGAHAAGTKLTQAECDTLLEPGQSKWCRYHHAGSSSALRN